MNRPLSRCRRPLLFSLALVLAGTPLPASGSDPFLPGPRWVHAPPPTSPWLALDARFAAHDELVWSSAALAGARLSLLSSSDSGGAGGADLAAAALDEVDLAARATTLSAWPVVAAGSRVDALYAALQTPGPGGARSTRVVAYDALGTTTRLAERWSYDPRVPSLDGPRLDASRDGEVLALALRDAPSGRLAVDRLRASGVRSSRTWLTVSTLRAFALAGGGSRLALVAGARLIVIDEVGSVVHDSALSKPSNALALSFDGSLLAVGDASRVRLFQDDGLGYLEVPSIAGAAAESAVRLALARPDPIQAPTLAIAWWNTVTGTELRFEVRAGPTSASVFSTSQPSAPGGLQNLPTAVCLTEDGRRAAFGCWGQLDAKPEVVLVDRDSAQVVLALDLPGSVQSLDLDHSGTRLVVARRHGHANQPVQTGEVAFFETGERDVAVRSIPRLGGRLELSANLPGAQQVWFLLGQKLPTPIQPPLWLRPLWIDRAATLSVQRVDADGAGRADLALRLPSSLAWAGTPFAVQALGRVAGKVIATEVVLEPLLLP